MPGSTTFHQGEQFFGIMWFMARPEFLLGKDIKKNFEAFNGDLQARVESL